MVGSILIWFISECQAIVSQMKLVKCTNLPLIRRHLMNHIQIFRRFNRSKYLTGKSAIPCSCNISDQADLEAVWKSNVYLLTCRIQCIQLLIGEHRQIFKPGQSNPHNSIVNLITAPIPDNHCIVIVYSYFSLVCTIFFLYLITSAAVVCPTNPITIDFDLPLIAKMNEIWYTSSNKYTKDSNLPAFARYKNSC